MQWLTNLLSSLRQSDPKIRNIFFNLIQNNKGSITVIDFARATDLSGTDAKKILDRFSVEFDATFDVTEEGQVVYLFPTTTNPIAKEVLSESKTDSPILEPKNSNTSQPENESKKETKPSFANINDDVKQQVNNINSDVKQKVEDIKKIENDLKNMGKSMNDLFKF